LDATNHDLSIQYPVVYAEAVFWADWVFSHKIIVQEPLLKDWTTDELKRAFISIYLSSTVSLHIQENKLWAKYTSHNSGSDFTSGKNGQFVARMFYSILGFAVAQKVLQEEYDLEDYDVREYIFRYASIVTYGDDSIISLSDKLGWFTPAVLVDLAASLFNYKLTASDKTPLVCFLPTSKLTFLKRSFRQERGFIYAPLDKDALLEQLFWCKDPHNQQKNAIDVADSALRESVHHGRDFFTYVRDLLTKVCYRAQIPWTPLDFDALDLKLRHS
jgi:hypothetical protein